MADRFNDDDLMFGELPDDDDLNGSGEEDADANNDETFGGPLPSGNYDELEDYATQTADLRLDDLWDTPGCSSAAPPASALPMPTFDFTNFGSGSFDFLGSDSKLESIWGQNKVDSLWPDIPSLSNIYEKAEVTIKAPSPPRIAPIAPPQSIQEPKPIIPTMPKAPTLEEVEKMHSMTKQQEAVRPLIPAIPTTAMSAEDLERKMLQETQLRNQTTNGSTPVPPIPPLIGNITPNPVALRICPAIPPVFVPCFVPWLDVLTGRIQNLPPGCPPPPHFVINLLQHFRNPVTVMNIIQAAVTPMGPPPPFMPPMSQHNTAPPTPSSQHGWHQQHPRKPPGMPSARTIEDLAFDQFAGYMSIKERQWLVKIQILQCQGTNNPYEDDYYYLCWRQKKIAEGMQPKPIKESRSETKEIINDSKKNRKNRERNGSTSEGKEKEDRVTTLATRFAGSLGIPTKASTHNPRHSIRVQHPDLDEDQEKRIAGHQKKLRTLLMRIESATSLLIECADRRVTLSNAASQANKENLVAEINERVDSVLKELFCEEFFRVMQVSKGRGLITRIIRVAMPESISRLLVILIRQAKHATTSAPLQKCIIDLEEDIFPAIYKALMVYQREALVSIVMYLKIEDLLSALNDKITFVRDLFLLFLLVCSEKKAAPHCDLFQWLRSVGSLDLSSGWSTSETTLWNMLSLSREDIQTFGQWLYLLVNESSYGSVASKIAQRLVAY